MRIAFVGKGGSGKTTLASLFIRHLTEQNHPVLAIDADINQHLGSGLGLSDAAVSRVPALSDDLQLIKEYLRGKNPRIFSASDMIKTTPPGTGSRLLTLKNHNPIFGTFGRKACGATFLAAGEFNESDIGVKCYHSKTGAVELLLNHIVDGENEYIVVDMTAGADSFASGLFTRFDLTVIVVEPTKKSLSVFEQYQKYAKEYGVHVAVVANKIEDESDLDFISSVVGDALIAQIGRSSYVRKTERGEIPPYSECESETREAMGVIKQHLDKCEKNWDKFHAHTVHFHEKNARSWANDAVGRDLCEQIDPDFSYPVDSI